MASQFRKSREKIAAAGGERNRRRAPVVAPSVGESVSPAEQTVTQPASPATRVGVKLEKGWHKRNFLTEVLLPSLLSPRDARTNTTPLFPALAGA